jgi:putative ABC transport system substrate-binding protein
MNRRAVMSMLSTLAAWPLAARAQQPGKLPTIGVLYGVSAAEWTEHMAGFHRGLGETGFVEGRNVAVEYRWAEGQLDRMPWMAADLIGRQVSVLLTGGNTAGVRALIAATKTIPIVFTTGADPVATGLVASLNRPGGNATGVTVVGTELGPKRLELLHEIVPAARRIAVLVNPNNQVTLEGDVGGAQAAARRLGLDVVVVKGSTENEIEAAFASAVQQGAGAVFVSSDAVLQIRRRQIATLALRHALPTMSAERASVQAGQLMSYATNMVEIYRQAGIYVGRILNGTKPADLPVVQATKFELVINLKTAKTLGLDVSPTLLATADEVIE